MLAFFSTVGAVLTKVTEGVLLGAMVYLSNRLKRR